LVDKIIAGFVLILWSRQKAEIYSDYFEKLDTCRGMVKAKANGAIRIAVVAGSRLDRHMKVARHSAWKSPSSHRINEQCSPVRSYFVRLRHLQLPSQIKFWDRKSVAIFIVIKTGLGISCSLACCPPAARTETGSRQGSRSG
jgi:hypothetical protein